MSPVGVAHPEALVGPDWSPGFVSSAPSVFRRGVPGVALSREKFDGSGLTRLLYRRTPYVPYATASDLAHLLTELIDRPDPPAVIYTYWDELDTVQHWRGPVDRLFGFEADRLAHLFEYVAAEVAPSRARATTVLVTADHGQVALDPAQQLRVDLAPEIAGEMARPLAEIAGPATSPPSRDARAPYGRPLKIACRAGAVSLRWRTRSRQGCSAPLRTTPRSPPGSGTFSRSYPVPSGLVSVPPGARPSPRGEFLGGHGGLTPEELLVPLVSGRLSEFARGPG